MGMFPGGQASCLQLSRRFTKDERGKRKKKPREAADRGRKERVVERERERGGVERREKCLACAPKGRKEGRKREDFLADFSGAFVFNLLPLIQTTRFACTYVHIFLNLMQLAKKTHLYFMKNTCLFNHIFFFLPVVRVKMFIFLYNSKKDFSNQSKHKCKDSDALLFDDTTVYLFIISVN